MYLAKVYVYLKKSVADPQGQTVKHGLESMGYGQVDDVRVGKYFEIRLKTTVVKEAEQQIKEMCEKLLVNSVIEDYSFELQH